MSTIQPSQETPEKCPISSCECHIKSICRTYSRNNPQPNPLRPEKCPIRSCAYHTKGFARKYDRNRHALTHYRGVIACSFCPSDTLRAQKTFQRADVYKRHLTQHHGVKQLPPNSRRRVQNRMDADALLLGYGQDVLGKCSICGTGFASAQGFCEHFDDCVLRVVLLEDLAEAIRPKL